MIKNKDGTIYKLQSPNPLVKEQVFWADKGEYIVHNLNWQKILIQLQDLIPEFEPEEIPVEVKLPEKEINVDVKEPPAVTPPIVEPLIVPKETKNSLNLNNLVLMHCQPTISKTHTDELYGDSYSKTSYGEKFTFEALVVQREDFTMLFWTNLKLEKGSVVYPSKYRDGTKYGDLRWWKVNRMTEKAGGYLVESVPSDYQPDFS